MSKRQVNEFTCDANGCNVASKPLYTIQATPDGWLSFEFEGRRVWACPLHAEWVTRQFGVME